MKAMRLSRFLGLSLLLLLVLMPIWYVCSAYFAKVVIEGAGWVLQSGFDWVKGIQTDQTIGVLQTDLRTTVRLPDGSIRVGKLAPKLDYRPSGYGLVIFWALLLASFPTRWWQKLLIGTGGMLAIQVSTLCFHWLNEVFNKTTQEVALQVLPSDWAREAVAFFFHFNIFILTPLAPVLVWFVLDRDFVKRLWSDLGLIPSA
jgi:hypothetical protein